LGRVIAFRPRFQPLAAVLLALAVLVPETTSGRSTKVATGAPKVVLASDGRARLPVVVAPNAAPAVQAAAQALAAYLGRMTGAPFVVTNANGRAGIAVGVPSDFPDVRLRPPFRGTDLTQRDDYLLLAHGRPPGVYVLGATERAVEFAVWDFLHRVGYRRYFPNPAWEIVPQQQKLTVNFNVHESPDYLIRNVGANFRWVDDKANTRMYDEWFQRNRLGETLKIWHIHMWHGIVSQFQKTFDANPEFYPLVDGQRQTNASKFCSAHPGVRDIAFQFATNYFIAYPCDGVSMDPTDGSWHYCEDDRCKQVGGRTEQVVDLANDVARRVRALGQTDPRFQNKYVGINAYNVYCAPPAIAVDPRVSVQVANGLMGDGKPWTIAELLDGWSKKTTGLLGIYDYYSLIVWGANKPNNSLAGNTGYIADSIPAAHRRYGLRTFTSEGGIDFGPCGLGYYLASRLLWDTTESAEAIQEEFFTNCFGSGPCRETMGKFYDQIDVGNHGWAVIDRVDLIGRMYRHLQTALSQTTDPQIRERIHQLLLYTRYADLEWQWEAAPRDEEKIRAMLSFAYRIKDTHMVHSAGLWHGLGLTTDPSWKQTNAFTNAEYDQILTDGIARHPLHPFTPVKFSRDLVPATPLKLPPVTNGHFRSIMAEPQIAYTWVSPGQTSVTVRVTNGEQPQKVYLYSGTSQYHLEDHREVMHQRAWQQDPVAPDDNLTLTTTKTGLHRIQRVNYHNMGWDIGMPMTFPTGSMSLNYGDHIVMYFYVPKGTKTLAFWDKSPYGVIRDANGTERYDLSAEGPLVVSIAVPPGQDGALWRVENQAGIIHFFTIPPYFARNEKELLLPREVVEADRKR
jgi:hypothetical protein